jgi:hypothetical protein
MVTQVFSCDFPSVPGFSAVLENAELGARGVLPAGTSLRWGSFLNIVLIPTSYIYYVVVDVVSEILGKYDCYFSFYS